MGKPLDLVGKRFGRLTVVSRIGMNEKRCVMWKCKCDCGKEIMLPTKHLRSQNVISCGCNRIEKSKDNLSKIPCSEKLGLINGTNLSKLSASKPQRNNACGVRGVSLLPNGTYRAYVYFQRKRYNAGVFHDLESAKIAVEELRKSIVQIANENADISKWLSEHKTNKNEKRRG